MLSGLACSTPAPEDTSWQVVENRHFVLYAQGAKVDGPATLLDLERFRAAVASAVGIRPRRLPRVRIVVFESARQAGGLLDGGWSSGFAATLPDGDVAVTSRGRPGLERLYVEAFLAGRAPHWYAQGMADLLSTLRVEDGLVTIGVPPRGYARKRRPPASEQQGEEAEEVTGSGLLTDEAWKPGAAERRRDYWLLTHYLFLASRTRAEGLREYLRLWRLGTPSTEAFEQAIGRPPDELYREEVARHLERGIRARTVPLSGYAPDEDLRVGPADADAVRTLLEGLRAWQARREPPPGR